MYKQSEFDIDVIVYILPPLRKLEILEIFRETYLIYLYNLYHKVDFLCCADVF